MHQHSEFWAATTATLSTYTLLYGKAVSDMILDCGISGISLKGKFLFILDLSVKISSVTETAP